jgi:hypothetical protein
LSSNKVRTTSTLVQAAPLRRPDSSKLVSKFNDKSGRRRSENETNDHRDLDSTSTEDVEFSPREADLRSRRSISTRRQLEDDDVSDDGDFEPEPRFESKRKQSKSRSKSSREALSKPSASSRGRKRASGGVSGRHLDGDSNVIAKPVAHASDAATSQTMIALSNTTNTAENVCALNDSARNKLGVSCPATGSALRADDKSVSAAEVR